MARNPGRKSKADEVEEEVEEQEEEQEEQGGDGEEFEIEAIVSYKVDAFKDPPDAGYKVKWKGYDSTENSWVRPEDATGAWELIEAWWQKKNKPNPHAHLKPDADEDEEMQEAQPTPEPEPAPASKKRGRPSATAVVQKSEVKEDAEPKKRGRKSNGATTATAPPTKKARRTSSPLAPAKNEVTETIIHPSKLANWKDRKDWSTYVTEITTIEHDETRLVVFFKLKGLKDPCSEPVKTARERFPTKLLDFYEKNLRWRSVEGSDVEDE